MPRFVDISIGADKSAILFISVSAHLYDELPIYRQSNDPSNSRIGPDSGVFGDRCCVAGGNDRNRIVVIFAGWSRFVDANQIAARLVVIRRRRHRKS